MSTHQIDDHMRELKAAFARMSELSIRLFSLGARAILHPSEADREAARPLEEQLDEFDDEIEARCHHLIARLAPVASDMRFIVSASRATVVIEQIGDLGESLTKRARYLARHQPMIVPPIVQQLSTSCEQLVSAACAAFNDAKPLEAERVMQAKAAVDASSKQARLEVQALMTQAPDRVPVYAQLFRAVGHLEQASDLAVQLADEALYTIRGELSRHRHRDYRA